MDLTIGPNQFFWDAAIWRDFYLRLADEAPVERVVLGELICSKRLPFYHTHFPEVIERLRPNDVGKTNLMSSPALAPLTPPLRANSKRDKARTIIKSYGYDR